MECNATRFIDGAVNTANDSITIKIKIEVGFKGKSSTGIGINPAMATYMVPIVIEIPCMQAISSSIFPENSVDPTYFSSGEGFPASKDTFMNLGTTIGNLDWSSAIH